MIEHFRHSQVITVENLGQARKVDPDLNSERREVNRLTYLQNSDVLSSWEWCTSKGTRSCIYCLAMDGRRFSLHVSMDWLNYCENEEGCRCTTIPVIKGIERPPRTIASDWFAQQSEETQQRMLGEHRFAEYKNGKSLGQICGL